MASAVEHITLDYGDAGRKSDLLMSLSAVASSKGCLWTASDEGRSVECLVAENGGYRLKKQHKLDSLFKHLPKKKDPYDHRKPEADIESLAAHDGALWICGSHAKVRRRRKLDENAKVNTSAQAPYALVRSRPSRCLLGRVPFNGDAQIEAELDKASAAHLPFAGTNSLRTMLKQDRFLQPFVRLPSKENGLDIEGVTVTKDGAVFLGLRGPLIETRAVIVKIELDEPLDVAALTPYFLDLGGLGVRDLTRRGDDILILAGPVSGLGGGFSIHCWTPGKAKRVQTTTLLYRWPEPPPRERTWPEHPEAICCLERGNRDGLLVLYDNPDADHRIKEDGRCYIADWIPV
jgi:Protein of unknown function (DUF3616)